MKATSYYVLTGKCVWKSALPTEQWLQSFDAFDDLGVTLCSPKQQEVKFQPITPWTPVNDYSQFATSIEIEKYKLNVFGETEQKLPYRIAFTDTHYLVFKPVYAATSYGRDEIGEEPFTVEEAESMSRLLQSKYCSQAVSVQS